VLTESAKAGIAIETAIITANKIPINAFALFILIS
jgi:hypothetical protein